MAEAAAKLLNLHVGSTVVWTTPQKTFSSKVAAIHQERSRAAHRAHRISSSRPKRSRGFPAIYYGGIRATAASVPAIQKAVYDRFPTITVVNMADVLDTIQSVVDQISLVVRFISAFSILAGAIILASSVAGTRFRRIREVVILKTLGATRRRIAQIFSIEFLVIGTVAGLMGGLLAGGFALGGSESSARREDAARLAADAGRRSRARRCSRSLPAGWPASARWARSRWRF